MARILAIAFCFKFVASPLSYSYYIVGKTKEDFVLHVWIAASSAAALAYGTFVANDPRLAVLLFSINYAFVYVFYLVRSYKFASGI